MGSPHSNSQYPDQHPYAFIDCSVHGIFPASTLYTLHYKTHQKALFFAHIKKKAYLCRLIDKTISTT